MINALSYWLHTHQHPSSGRSWREKWRWKHPERSKAREKRILGWKNVQSLSAQQREVNRKDSLIQELMNDWANTSSNSLPITFLFYINPNSLCLFICFLRAAWDQKGEVMNEVKSHAGQKQHLDSKCVFRFSTRENYCLAFQDVTYLQTDITQACLWLVNCSASLMMTWERAVTKSCQMPEYQRVRYDSVPQTLPRKV